MGHLQVHCEGCGSDWSVYHRDDWKDWKARTCPVCGKSVYPGTWSREILRAFGEMEDANIELLKDHQQSNGTLFTVSYIPDVVFPNKGSTDGLREEIEDLKESVEEVKGLFTKLLEEIFKS